MGTKSMTKKTKGNTTKAVEALVFERLHCLSRACAVAGGLLFHPKKKKDLFFTASVYLIG